MDDTPMTPDQRRAVADGKAWEEFGERFSWQLHGWSYSHSATFFTDTSAGPAIQISDAMRDSISAAITDAVAQERERCIQKCRDLQKTFLSEEYSVNQPESSIFERFACGRCIEAIEAPSTPDTAPSRKGK